MSKGEEPRPGLASTIHDFEQRHRVLAALAYMGVAAVLVGILSLVGVIQFPGSSPASQEKPSASASSTGGTRAGKTTGRSPSLSPDQSPAGDWRERPGRKAAELMGRMTDLLDTRLGVNDNTLRTEVAFQESDTGSSYYKSEQAFTDAVKQAGTEPPKDAAGADAACSRLDRLYADWQGQAWTAANSNLDSQIDQMMASAELGRSYLRQHKDYPASCSAYTRTTVATGGSTRKDIERKVEAIRAFNDAFNRCAADMSPEQASRMPQR